jgi:hypothetical protein
LKAAERVPGDWLLHPVVLLSAVLLGLNDHLFKGVLPGIITGKLSDFAGLVFFPLFLLSLVEWTEWVVTRRVNLHPRIFFVATFMTAAVFSVINLDQQAGALYRSVVQETWTLLRISPGVVHHTVDAPDLIALVSLLVPLSLFRKRQLLEASTQAQRGQSPWKVPA